MSPNVILISNPFEPFASTCVQIVKGTSVREYVDTVVGVGNDFELPTLCLLNGEPLLRSEWHYKTKDDDIISIVTLPGDPVTIIIQVVLFIVALAVSLLLAPKIPGELGDSDPAYSLSGQSNRIRLGEPIESSYGKTVSWPSYGSRVFNQYINNEQFQYSLFCLGQGSYTIHELFIEDTPLSQFDDVEFEVVGPGGAITLFPDNVITSVEVGGIELLGSNEPSYPVDGWFGAFVANPAGTLTSILQVDIVFPQGLYKLSEGKRKSRTVTYEIGYREIDDAGDPVSSFQTTGDIVITRKTGTPQRFTEEVAVTPGRYEVRVRRVGTASDNAAVADTVTWESMRAFLPSTKLYGDVTMLATKIRATNQINNSSRSRIRVDKTRHVPIWDGAVFGAAVPTRNPIWAMIDIFKAQYGGRLTDSFLKLDDLLVMADLFDARGDTFDFTFDRRLTVWGAAQTVMRSVRSVPMLFGSQIGVVRDGPQTLVQAVFNKENIVRGSFEWDLILADNEEHDHVVVEYTSPLDGVTEEVICRLPTDGDSFPEHIKMLGITSRDQAFREGMFYRGTRRYQRESVTFRTGLEGHIPAWGDLVRIAYDVPRWGFGGFIVSYDAGHVSGPQLVLSDPVGILIPEPSFDKRVNYIAFRGKDGAQIGTIQVINPLAFQFEPGGPNIDKRVIFLLEELPSEIVDELQFADNNSQPTYFALGIGENVGKIMKVSNLQPSGEDEVEVTCVTYTDKVFAYDDDPAPSVDEATLPPKVPSAPTVTGLALTVVKDRDDILTASWKPSFGAQFYILQRSDDGTAGSWTEVIQTPATSFVVDITPGDLYLRVAGVNESVGPFTQINAEVGIPGDPPIAPVFTAVSPFDWTGLTITAFWEPYPVSGAQSYKLRVYDTDDVIQDNEIRLVELDALTGTYSSTEMIADLGEPNVIRDVTFGVAAVNAAGESEETQRAYHNDPPVALQNIAAVFNSDSGTGKLYDLTWDQEEPVDFKFYRVYMSTEEGFTPVSGDLEYEDVTNSFQIEVPFITGAQTVNRYLLIGSFDVFGSDITNPNNFTFAGEILIEGTYEILVDDGDGNQLQDDSGNILVF